MELEKEFSMRVKQLKEERPEKWKSLSTLCYVDLMADVLIPYIRDKAMTDGILLSDEQAYMNAHQWFCSLKKDNLLDKNNCVLV